MKRKQWAVCLCILIFLAALLLTLYPVLSTRYNSRHQSRIRVQHMEKISRIDDTRLREERSLAQDYNRRLLPGVTEQEAFDPDALSGAADQYESLLNLAGDRIMGYVEIPGIQVYLPIYHGTRSDVLDRGIGHLLGSSLPVGGPDTHAVLTAHSGMASQVMFSDLPQLREEDVFFLHVLGERHAYRVDRISTVLPYETQQLRIVPGEDLCTLVTCTPFGVNTHRLLVRGTRIPWEEARKTLEAPETPERTESGWMEEYLKGIFAGAGVLLAGLACVIPVVLVRRRHHDRG